MKKFAAISNLFILIALIYWNYLSNTGIINNTTIGNISAEYQNLFTPASYAFSIWGIIYVALFIFSIKLVFIAFKENDKSGVIQKIGPWMIIANILNGLWIFAWLSEYTGLSVIIMFSILISLLLLIIRLKMERATVPNDIKIWIWQPVGLYAGWITVAAVANVSAWLAKLNWSAWFTEQTWAIIIIITACIIYLFVFYTRRIVSFTLVGVWAFIAIAVRHRDVIPELQYTALISALVLIVFIVISKFIKPNKG
jgi:hypothetical protein